MHPRQVLQGASLVFFAATSLVQAQGTKSDQPGGKEPDNDGTDPTRLISSAAVQYEHLALRNSASSGTMRFSYTMPMGEKRDYSVRLRVPVTRLDAPGYSGNFGLGDTSVQLTHVFGLTRSHGFVANVEVAFDTARRAELGTGKTVLNGTLIYALFLEGGHIFAPAVKQSNSVAGDPGRPSVNSTVFDFYFVPKLADPRYFMTVDPSLSLDWEQNRRFVSLAVTAGRAVGPALSGVAQVFVKPSLFAGHDRPANWGLEVGFRILGL